MKHSHRVHSSKRNLSPKAKSSPVERREGNGGGRTELAMWMGVMPRYGVGGGEGKGEVGGSRSERHLYHLKGSSFLTWFWPPAPHAMSVMESPRQSWTSVWGHVPTEGTRRGGQRQGGGETNK